MINGLRITFTVEPDDAPTTFELDVIGGPFDGRRRTGQLVGDMEATLLEVVLSILFAVIE